MRRSCGERVSGRNNSLCKGPEAETSLDLEEQTENQYVCVCVLWGWLVGSREGVFWRTRLERWAGELSQGLKSERHLRAYFQATEPWVGVGFKQTWAWHCGYEWSLTGNGMCVQMLEMCLDLAGGTKVKPVC